MGHFRDIFENNPTSTQIWQKPRQTGFWVLIDPKHRKKQAGPAFLNTLVSASFRCPSWNPRKIVDFETLKIGVEKSEKWKFFELFIDD